MKIAVNASKEASRTEAGSQIQAWSRRPVVAAGDHQGNLRVRRDEGQAEIADRPAAPYGRLRAMRPGDYLLLDTTRLDVFAMDPVTLRWVQCELTIAMDLYDRCVTGLRLTPVST